MSTLKEKIRKLFSSGGGNKYGLVVFLVFIILLFQAITGGIMFRPLNVANIILQNSYIMILAIGMLLCILTGNVDLSVGSVAAFISAMTGVMIVSNNIPVLPTIFIALIMGALIGAFNGFWIAYLGIPAFITTLGAMLIFRGLTLGILKGVTLGPYPGSFQIIASGFIPDLFGKPGGFHVSTMVIAAVFMAVFTGLEIKKYRMKNTYSGEPGKNPISFFIRLAAGNGGIFGFSFLLASYAGLPNVLILIGFLVFAYTFVTSRTILGRQIYAFGGNPLAAQLSGVKTKWVFFWVYVNNSILASLGGMVYAARLNAASPRAGNLFELDAIAACYIGGASAKGGIGTIPGVIVGALIMGIMNNGMSIMGLGIDWQQMIKGLVLILAVAFDMLTKK